MHLQHGFEILNERPVFEAHRLTSLPVLVLVVHNRCNCRCIMCDIWRNEQSSSLTAESVRHQVRDIRRLGVEWVVFSGGEPLMNPALFAIADLLKKEGIRLTLLTTGILLSRYARQVLDFIDEVIVSLDGPREVHNHIRNVPRAFDLLSEGVASLKSRRSDFPVRARMTVQSANYLELCRTADTAHELSLDSISYLAVDVSSTAFNRALIWPTPRQDSVALNWEQVPDFQAEVERLIMAYSKDIDSGFIAESPAKLRALVHHFSARVGLEVFRAPRCNAPWTSAVIEADGSVRPCFFHAPIGNIHEGSLAEQVNSASALRFRAGLDMANDRTCQQCVCSLNYETKIARKEIRDAS